MSSLWRDNPATSAQKRFVFKRPRKSTFVTQAQVIAKMLRRARSENRALELPEIMTAGIAQFTARIFELRERGFVIENELRRSPDHRVLSRYWLRFDPEEREGNHAKNI